MSKGLTMQEIKMGDSASFTKTITEADITLFAGYSGDFNPAHINAVEADKSMFHGRIAHGMLSAGFISAVLGMQLPGPGTIYMGPGAALCQACPHWRHRDRYRHRGGAQRGEESPEAGDCGHQSEW